jgi:hypothetical protein
MGGEHPYFPIGNDKPDRGRDRPVARKAKKTKMKRQQLKKGVQSLN